MADELIVWAEWDKDSGCWTGNIVHSRTKPVSSKAYSWLVWKHCTMTFTEIKIK